MYVKLTDKDGNVFRSFVNDEHKPVVIINDTEYEIYTFSESPNMDHALTPAEIAEFDADPEIREMIEQSKIDIKNGQVYSTQQMIDMIRSGEI
jgi:UDP-N-acetylglucosamine transferase subunit ALG13